MKMLILDLESNGLLMQATQIWVVCTLDIQTGQIEEFYNATELQEYIDQYDKVIGHNILMFDMPLLNKLWGITYDYTKLIDTLIISRLLLPDRPFGHSLDSWGKRLGEYKGEFTDFSRLSRAMVEYCIQDTKVTAKLFNTLQSELKTYGEGIKKALRIEHEFAHIMSKQVLSGFRLDVEAAEKLYSTLKEEATPLYTEIKNLMPKVRDNGHFKKVKEEGNLIEEKDAEYTYIQNKTRKIVTKEFKFEEPNPGSRQQLVKWFKSKGWEPKEFTDKSNPEINETILLEINTNESKKVARLFRIQKQMSMINDAEGSWLRHYNKDTQRVHGNINTNSTNTGRCSHNSPNMAQVDKKDLRMREVWIAPEGRNLVGTDASGLELRVLGHYLYPYDKGAFAFECTNGDIHTYNQKLMGLQERNSAKTAIYALIYGAGNEKLGITYTKDQKIYGKTTPYLINFGKKLRETVEDNFTGYKELLDKVKEIYKLRGHLISIDGRPLHPRSDYSALNLLIQSCGAIICKQWTINLYNMLNEVAEYGNEWELHGNIHDEIQLSIIFNKAHLVENISKKSMQKTQKDLGIKTILDSETKIGLNWGQTH